MYKNNKKSIFFCRTEGVFGFDMRIKAPNDNSGLSGAGQAVQLQYDFNNYKTYRYMIYV